MNDIFAVTSKGTSDEHITRIVYAAIEDDARQTPHDNYPGGSPWLGPPRINQLTSITKSIKSSAGAPHSLVSGAG
jgi:hypothetical protein